MKNLILPLSLVFSGLFPFVFCMAKTDMGIFGKEISHKIIPVVDRDYSSTAKKLIQEAEKSICISMFVMKRGKKPNNFVNLLIEELKTAAKRGIQIRILLENKEENRSTVDFLRGDYIRNIEIKFDSPQKTTHNKIVIIDEDTILIGSTNWTEKSIGHANEANVVIKDKEVTEYFQEYFDRLWKDSSKDISPFKNFTGDIIPLIDRQYFDVVKELMSKSTQRIFVMVYGFKLSETGDTKGDVLANEMIKAKRRKVEIKVLLEKSNFSKQLNKMNSATIQYFKENGVNARFDSKNIITHSKVVIIDDTVVLGATNWSYSGLEKWHNIDILIREREIVDFFVNYFEEKFNGDL